MMPQLLLSMPMPSAGCQSAERTQTGRMWRLGTRGERIILDISNYLDVVVAHRRCLLGEVPSGVGVAERLRVESGSEVIARRRHRIDL